MSCRSSKNIAFAVALFLGAGAICSVAAAAEPGKRIGPDPTLFRKTASGGIDYLRTRGQDDDGAYSKETGIGVTALATIAILRHGRSPSDPLVGKSLAYLERSIQPDGGIHAPGTFLRNYETCLTLLCFQEANRKGCYDKTIRRGEAFLKGLQWDEDESKEVSDYSYGGAGYGKHERPDLSNTVFLIEALHACGNDPDDEAIIKALVFVSRCQNLETEHNTTPHASKNPDGGFYYTCSAGGDSKSGVLPNGGLRSYPSMTYAGLKSMIYAGLGPDDPRVKAAHTWIRKNYNLKHNGGLGTSGLYYYYHTVAKTFDAMAIDHFVDAHGVKHDWRRELAEELASRQRPDGSWVNKNTRWLEGDPNLVTAYALLALSYCRPKK